MISVIIPVYNVEKYLSKCIDSVINQIYNDLEIILIDDGSTDNSAKICDEYASLDDRIKVIHQINQGVCVARNTGLKMATGDYVSFIDSDDYIDSNMYESMMDINSKYNCDIVMCDCIKEYSNISCLYSHNIEAGYYNREKIEKEYFKNLIIMPDVEYPPTISNCLCLLRKDVINKYNIQYKAGIKHSEDLLFGVQFMYRAKSFYYLKGQAYYHYNCENLTSATHTYSPDKWKDYKTIHSILKETFYNNQTSDFNNQVDKVLLFFAYNVIGDIPKDISLANKMVMIKGILNDNDVKEMFRRTNIARLPISSKLKLYTFCYKYKVGLRFLFLYRKIKK